MTQIRAFSQCCGLRCVPQNRCLSERGRPCPTTSERSKKAVLGQRTLSIHLLLKQRADHNKILLVSLDALSHTNMYRLTHIGSRC
jgi:hypothetical protein